MHPMIPRPNDIFVSPVSHSSSREGKYNLQKALFSFFSVNYRSADESVWLVLVGSCWSARAMLRALGEHANTPVLCQEQRYDIDPRQLRFLISEGLSAYAPRD